MPELIAHLCGDYVLQNHWMAQNKVRAWLPAFVHASLYMLPFLLLTTSPAALAVMWSTHLLIDRFRLARYWVEFWGVGMPGFLWMSLGPAAMCHTDEELMELNRGRAAPDWLAVWLLILVDNTIHLGINHAAMAYL